MIQQDQALLGKVEIGLALSKTLEEFELVAVNIARSAGINDEQLSRVRNGRKDVHSGLIFRVLRALPMEARLFFLLRMGVFDFDESENPRDLIALSTSLETAWHVAETDSKFLQN